MFQPTGPDNPSRSLTEATYARIRADIVACRLAPGSKLKINDLGQKQAVREALSRLTAEGLITAEPQRGFHVAPISVADLQDLTRVRCQIEGACLRSAIQHGDVPWESQMLAALHAMSRTPATPAGPDGANPRGHVHAVFHRALVSACDSPWLLRIREQLYVQSERYRQLSMAKGDRDLDGEHRRIVDAALARDADLAVELLTQHLNRTAQA